MQDKKPSEKIIANNYDGIEILDEKNRILKLRKPDVLDFYDLMSALGEDAKNPACSAMASNILYIGMIDGQIVSSPKSYAEVRATLKRVGQEGLQALTQYMSGVEKNDEEKEGIEKVKK